MAGLGVEGRGKEPFALLSFVLVEGIQWNLGLHWVRKVAGVREQGCRKGAPGASCSRDPRKVGPGLSEPWTEAGGIGKVDHRGGFGHLYGSYPAYSPLGHIPVMIPGVALSDGDSDRIGLLRGLQCVTFTWRTGPGHCC